MSVVLFLHLFSFFFFPISLPIILMDRLLGIMAAQKHIDGCGWPALTTFQKSLIKMAHEMACDRPPCIDLVLTNSFLQAFFLSGPDKGFMLDQITKASFLNELLYTDLLVSSSLFFHCCSKWSHQLLHCAWEDLLILCSSETSLLNNAPEIVGDWWIWHRPFSHWSGQEWLEVF